MPAQTSTLKLKKHIKARSLEEQMVLRLCTRFDFVMPTNYKWVHPCGMSNSSKLWPSLSSTGPSAGRLLAEKGQDA